MLINRVPDTDGGAGEGREVVATEENHSHEYQTASELFELMAKNQTFNSSNVESLTTSDLVLLYKNLDLGTKLMSDANEFKIRKPNQYVETIIYDDPESDGSEISEIYSNEDLHNVVLINKERIDLLNNEPSIENTLCHKLGDLQIQSSDLYTEYDKHFLFKDPYIKEQLKSLSLVNNSNELESVLPASLLDYICCKRLEDNYNFYMDNIIRYVKHTIEQLKRISNGDYLTDKAKEKWREVQNNKDIDVSCNTKILATSTSIPLHVECKTGGLLSKWDELIHSEVDVRSLSKILEKKIILEVPKLICGSYKLLSKCCADNLIISCQKEKHAEKGDRESRVNVVFQLKRSNSGKVMSNISSIMILTTAKVESDSSILDVSPIVYDTPTNKNILSENSVKIVEIEQNVVEGVRDVKFETPKRDYISDDFDTEDSFQDSFAYPCSNYGNVSLREPSCKSSTASTTYGLCDVIDKKSSHSEVSFNIVPPDELRVTMQRLNMQSSVPEESVEDQSLNTMKKKSSTRVRIKSPYENKSHIIEEKKRKKLLEIRDRREKKKIALAENCKITKHKYGRNAIMPQTSNSVTKLSITNKAFYNSIYGQSTIFEKQGKGKNRKDVKKDNPEGEAGDTDGDSEAPIIPDWNNEKYTNKSYYLDDAVTEIEMKQNEKNDGTFSASTSEVSNDFPVNLHLLSQLIGPSVTDFNIQLNKTNREVKSHRSMDIAHTEDKNTIPSRELITSQSINNLVPLNTPIHEKIGKSSSSVECRRSIDKIYNLMKKFGKQDSYEIRSSKIKLTTFNEEKFTITGGRGSSTFQGSDSGTSVKHHLTSSNPSCFSFEKKNNTETKVADAQNKLTDAPSAIVPKVIISSKSRIPKTGVEKSKQDYKKVVINASNKMQDNPLKAISQLLHEFEHVQKTRQKSAVEQKSKKPELNLTDHCTHASNYTEARTTSRQNPTRRHSRLEQHMKENLTQLEKGPKTTLPQKKPKLFLDVSKNHHQQNLGDEKHMDKLSKKKIVDIMDEVKEARGEAVRGPSKINSRLNSLAQPKRSYVQAHSEEYHFKYGKNLMADRLQRLAATPQPINLEKNISAANNKNKIKRIGLEPVTTVSVRQPPSPVPPSERVRFRRSTSSGPVEKSTSSPGRGATNKQNNVLETPETLKKKMVAVETYVKSHYGSPPGAACGPVHSTQMSRVPLLPSDLELASLTSSPSPNEDEATAIGIKLHRIINTMISTAPHGLSVLAECQESSSKIIKDDTEDNFFNDNLSRCDEHMSTDSEYNVDIFEDRNVQTAVECVKNVIKKEQLDEEIGEENIFQYGILTSNSVTQLGSLENTLYRRMSLGMFQKQLRTKQLTLTPKESMQHVVLLQSSHAGSYIEPISQNFKNIPTTTDNLENLITLPVLSNSQLDWNFAKFPLQIATVGYAFPQYKSLQFETKSKKLLDKVTKPAKYNISMNCVINDKDSQCYKGENGTQLQQVALTENQKQIERDVNKINNIISQKTKVKSDIKEIYKENQSEAAPKSEKIDNKEEMHKYTEKEKSPTFTTDNNSENLDYTTSLDVLVGLLNEIKKITTCQTNMTISKDHNNTNSYCKELETILNNAAALENSAQSSPRDMISRTSLDKLRQLESNPSIYSFYLSEDDQVRKFSKLNLPSEILRNINSGTSKPIYVDKEVGVDLLEPNFVNRFTDVPSKFFPIAVNHSTNVTSSLIGVISEPSTQSLFSFTGYHTIYSKTSTLNTGKNIELPEITSYVNFQQHSVISGENIEIEKVSVYEKPVKKKTDVVEISTKTQKEFKANKSKLCLLTSDFDPIIKIKRDVLVTVYSILVVTVFAALTFPELLYHF